MASLNYKRGIFKIQEEFGAGGLRDENEKPDIIVRFELLLSPPKISNLNNGKFSFRLLLPNYLINLDDEESEIYSKIHKNTRYKINRAMNRDDLLYNELINPTDFDIEEFRLFFNPFAKERNIRLCDVNKLKALRDQGVLIISYITDRHHQILCYHVYQEDRNQGYLIYSVSRRYENTDSSYRNLLGRANRYLHWRDIQSFKNKGCKWYNFGGKVINEEDRGGRNVNKFKLEFGTITGYDSRLFYSNSLIGKIGLIFFYLIRRQSPEYKFSENLQYEQNPAVDYERHVI